MENIFFQILSISMTTYIKLNNVSLNHLQKEVNACCTIKIFMGCWGGEWVGGGGGGGEVTVKDA